jgi:hypothetical protein
MTFSRASTGTFFGTEKVLSSENLLPYSENFGLWGQSGLLSRTGGQTDPAGGSTGFTLLEDSAGGFHRVYQNATASGDLAFTVFSKQNSGTRYLSLTLFNANNDWVAATFDLAGSAPATGSGSSSSFSGLTATQTASGNGYYKCVIKATGSIIAIRASLNNATSAPIGTYGLPSYTGDGSSSIILAFSGLSSIGSTDYSYTNGQIARSYQTKLQTAASGSARFEHSAIDGQSEGILIEGQSTNLVTRSEEFNSWTTGNASIQSNAAVAPDGTLSADTLTEAAETSPTTNSHYVYSANITPAASTSYTFSVYLKAAGRANALLYTNIGGVSVNSIFNLSNGTVTYTGGSVTNAISSVGNGWYRCSITWTTTSTAAGNVRVYTADGDTTFDYTGNGYGSVICWGAQVEASSFASSYTKTEAATVTRAADSMSMTDSSLFDNGSGALAAEYDMFAASETSYLLHIEKSSGGTNGGGISVTNRYLGVESNYLDLGNTTSNVFHKVAASWETGSQKMSRDGGAASEDTSTVLPSGTDKLFIGVRQDGGEPVNGHIKRLAIYSEPLSSTNLQALTS